MFLKSFLKVGEQAQIASQSAKMIRVQARILVCVRIKCDYTFCLWLTHGTIHRNRDLIVAIITFCGGPHGVQRVMRKCTANLE